MQSKILKCTKSHWYFYKRRRIPIIYCNSYRIL